MPSEKRTPVGQGERGDGCRWPAAAASDVSSATAAIASAARIGRLPVAKATTVRISDSRPR